MARRAAVEYEVGVLAGVVDENEIAEAIEEAAAVLEGVEELYAMDGLPVRASDHEVREAGGYE